MNPFNIKVLVLVNLQPFHFQIYAAVVQGDRVAVVSLVLARNVQFNGIDVTQYARDFDRVTIRNKF